MKRLIRNFITKGVGYKLIGIAIAKYSLYIGNYIQFHHSKGRGNASNSFEDISFKEELLRKSEVISGPFKGLKYPKIVKDDGKFIYGNLFPKLLGTYENELHEVLNELLKNTYSSILNIGSAEGYYSIGLAKYYNCRIVSFDIDPKAHIRYKEMVELNGAIQNLTFEKKCDSEYLFQYDFGLRGLIICDCEGYEDELFNEQNIENLINCDLIIELHDFAKPGISDNISELFKHTHELMFINSKTTSSKTRSYNYLEFKKLSSELQYELVNEQRPNQEWLVLKATNN